MPTECFIPKDFRYGTRDVIRKANAIIADPENRGYKLTLRQTYDIGSRWRVRGSNFHPDLVEGLDDLNMKREDNDGEG